MITTACMKNHRTARNVNLDWEKVKEHASFYQKGERERETEREKREGGARQEQHQTKRGEKRPFGFLQLGGGGGVLK